MKTIDELHKRGDVTIITITHYMNEATDADRVIVLNKGEVFMDGTPEQIFTQVETLHSVRLDVPQVTELFYKLKKAGAYDGGLPQGLPRDIVLFSWLFLSEILFSGKACSLRTGLPEEKRKCLKLQSHDRRLQALRGGQGIRTLAPFHRPNAFRVRPLEPLG